MRFEPINAAVPARKHVDVGARELKLLQDDATVAQVRVTGTTVDAVVSPDGKWVWRLSEGKSATVTLLNGDTLETIGTFRPRDMEDPDEFLEEWYEHAAVTSISAPDRIVIFANAGDSFVLLLTLRATAGGIVDMAGSRMFEAVEPRLDEVIGHATFVGPDRLLVVDDIGGATLLSCPDAEVVARADLSESFSSDGEGSGGYVVWPDDEPMDQLTIGAETFMAEGMILVSIYGGDPETLLAFAALNPETLEDRAIIRPPVRSAAAIRQIESNRFVVSDGQSERVMAIRID